MRRTYLIYHLVKPESPPRGWLGTLIFPCERRESGNSRSNYIDIERRRRRRITIITINMIIVVIIIIIIDTSHDSSSIAMIIMMTINIILIAQQ